MRRRNSAQGLILATVNVLVIVGVTFIVKSLAAGDAAPSQSSRSLPAESEFALPSPGARAALTSGGASSASLASPSAAAGQDTSAQVVPPSATGWEEAPAINHVDFGQLSDLPSRPFAPLVADSGSWPQLQASASGYGSSSAPSYSRRPGLGGGYSGMGGGFPSGGGGGGGRPSNAQNSQIDPASAALRSSSGGPTASAAGAPLLPSQAQGNPQGNPFLSGGNGLGGPPSFVLTQVPKLGSGGAVGSGLVLPTGAGGSTANVTQLQTPVSVPEPTTALLLGCGLALAAYRNRRRLKPRT
jgi:hypothetical protein